MIRLKSSIQLLILSSILLGTVFITSSSLQMVNATIMNTTGLDGTNQSEAMITGSYMGAKYEYHTQNIERYLAKLKELDEGIMRLYKRYLK